ncbi:phosphomannomutase/phosphoglucomutase [Aquisalimonas asiatica]|uniref:phosphomannomutase n=1 Tax=Aquisalimonas asiatica TaxID=406100 RepID=A0A1H8VG21_9GAMM|nr:phosphomannomutase/phosphoglucomutase [Aquisalimonas asiatica]SEP14157.1 phosphomannomutase / phosphoglucomutase [Aquisalimonas asiatica]
MSARAGGRTGSIWATALLLVVAITAAAFWLIRDAAQEARHAEQQARAGEVATALAGQVGEHVEQLRDRIRVAAAEDAVVHAAADGDHDSMRAAAEGVAEQFPAALRVMLLPPGHDEPALDAEPPLGYAALEMLRLSESGAAVTGPEAHLPGRAEAHLNLVAPVIREDAVIGLLLVSLPPEWLNDALALPGAADGRRVVAQDGDAVVAAGSRPQGGIERAASVPGSQWQVRIVTGGDGGVYRPLRDPWFLTIVGVAGTLILLVVVMTLRALRKRAAEPPAATAEDGSGGAAAPVAGGPEPVRAGDGGMIVEELAAEPQPGQDAPAAHADLEKENGLNVDPSLFRAYDIRGVVGSSLSADVVRQIGRSIGSEAAARGCNEVVVGRDGRLSSPDLAAALTEGLVAAGRQVIDIGQVPTPVMYFATHHLGTGTGVEITGSHNPPDYNGLKIMVGGETLSGDAIKDLHRRIVEDDLVAGEGGVRRQDVATNYIDAIAGDITLHRPLRVVLDAGNGVGGGIAPQVLQAIGCEVEPLYCEVDGTFPNHHPDPSDPHNLEALISLVRLQQADVGLALDGDGDRLGVVDAEGKIIWADRQMMLYARDVLSRNPGADIVFDVKCSSQLAQVITEHAGVPVMWRTGHSLIKAKLKQSGAPLAGEMSGHIFFNDRWPGFDDGIYTAARLLEILSMEDRSSTEVFAALPEAVSTPEIKVDLSEGEPPQVIERLVAAADFPEARVTTIDGLRVDFPDGWGLVRASNTTPCLVLRFEGDDETALERIRARFRTLLDQARPGLDLPF